MTSSKKAFTLIELLIVIAILGILMSLLFPAVNSAIDSARKAQAKNDVTQIATAVVAYETEYGRLPIQGTSDKLQSLDKALVEILAGVPGNTDNPRRISFLEVQAAKKGKSGTNSNGDFVDPWGNVYQVMFDLDDNTLSVTAGKLSAAGSDTISPLRKKVAVFNFPVSSAKNTDPNFYRKAVRSWE